MGKSAYIKFVQGSSLRSATLDDVRDLLARYTAQTSLTGTQLGWDYSQAAFPYRIQDSNDARWCYLQSTDEARYKHIIVGISEAASQAWGNVSCIQVVLPEGSTHGDKAKANELCRYMAKQTQAELTLFNGRTMYFNPRK